MLGSCSILGSRVPDWAGAVEKDSQEWLVCKHMPGNNRQLHALSRPIRCLSPL